jgi:hypothetical protein
MKAWTLMAAASAALVATGASAQGDPRAQGVLAAVQSQLGAGGFGPDARFAIAFSDLNDDHHDEALVHLEGRNFCGSGGCTTFVLTETEVGWLQIGRMTVSRLPIYRLPQHHGGWFDLGVRVGGGGVQPGVRAVRYERDGYRSNPTKGQLIPRLPQQATLVMPATSEFLPVGQ